MRTRLPVDFISAGARLQQAGLGFYFLDRESPGDPRSVREILATLRTFGGLDRRMAE
jgi:hypothetical protein